MLGFFRPTKRKLLFVVFAYGWLYILDTTLLTPAEELFIPITVAGFYSNPPIYLVLRFCGEVVVLYFTACFSFWLLENARFKK